MQWYLTKWWGRLISVIAVFDWTAHLPKGSTPLLLQTLSVVEASSFTIFIAWIIGIAYAGLGVIGLLFIVFVIKSPMQAAEQIAKADANR